MDSIQNRELEKEDQNRESASEDIPADANSQTTVLLSLENLIKRHISSIDKIQEETKKNKEMFDNEFLNSEAYRNLSEKLKEAQKNRNGTREQILKQPNMTMLSDKIKNMKQELKEMRLALSDYLLEYQRLSGLSEIQGEDGEFRQIINSAKAVRKSIKSR